MKQEKIHNIVDKFQSSFEQYNKLFLDNYPLFSKKEYDFGSRELNELGIQCQAYLSMLGATAKARMNFIGFQKLVAFNNEVDWYNWKIWITENKINHTLYLSISMRIDTEIKRMRVFLLEDDWEAYCSHSEEEYSVSYLRYKDFQPEESVSEDNSNDGSGGLERPQNIQIVVNNHHEQVEEKFFSDYIPAEKVTAILANITTFLKRISEMNS